MSSFITLSNADLRNQRVLVRLDLNAPVQDGKITDDTRIIRSLPTLNHLLNFPVKIILLSHFGRPKSPDLGLSLGFLQASLSDHLKQNVSFASDCKGPIAEKAVKDLSFGQILLLENLRFYKEEEQNDLEFSKSLAALGDIYVNDAFSCSHRSHASIVGIPQFLPSVAGLALTEELRVLNQVLTNPTPPVMAIVGGAKVSTKIALLKNLIKKTNYLAIAGGMANTFLAAQGHSIGQSLVEQNFISMAARILHDAKTQGCTILLPQDSRVLRKNGSFRETDICTIDEDDKIMDIGPETEAFLESILDICKTVIWNGPVGVFETPPFDQGSISLARKIAQLTQDQNLLSVAGGGDTLACLAKADCAEYFSYTSTAGGAFLEWLEGKTLPGIEALESSARSYVQYQGPFL